MAHSCAIRESDSRVWSRAIEEWGRFWSGGRLSGEEAVVCVICSASDSLEVCPLLSSSGS